MRDIFSRRNFLGGAMAVALAPQARPAASAQNLWSRGYALLPAPQKVELREGEVAFGSDWGLELDPSVNGQHVAVRMLVERLQKEFGITLAAGDGGSGPKRIRLAIRPGMAAPGRKEALARQGYKLSIEPANIVITGNDSPGLLYGVSTLMQLLVSKGRTRPSLPPCAMEDWPDLELRIMHWCEKEHQSRFETLKEYLDRAVEFKINAVGWHLEDTFAYQKHPAISRPTAFTREQVRALDDYARERHIELIPIVDFPAHMSFVLRRPEFVQLREVPESSYMMCPTKPESWKLLLEMFDEVLAAFQGKYFHFSTDELFFNRYLGATCGCAEKVKRLGTSGLFVELTLRASQYLRDRGKQVMFWGERPLDPQDIPKLPNALIDGAAGWYSLDRPGELEIERKHGMRVLIYFSMKGGEKVLFPDYVPFKYHDVFSRDHLRVVREMVSFGEVRKNDVLGTFMAAWDDHGPQLEVIWLGLVAGSAYGWHAAEPDPGELLPQFARLFYGPETVDMQSVYELMNDGALFWTFSWDRRRPIDLPNLPDPVTLDNKPFWRDHYEEIAFVKDRGQAAMAVKFERHVVNPRSTAKLRDLKTERVLSERLIALLQQNLGKVSRNRYNVDVMLALANVMRHNVRLFETLGSIEDALSEARRMQESGRYEAAVASLKTAERLAGEINADREPVYQRFAKTWEVSRFPSEQMDVFKRERDLKLAGWAERLRAIRQDFAQKHAG